MHEDNGHSIGLRQLRVFQLLLREHNLTRAAEALGVTQPALSRTLARLRGYFGDPLFVRVGHRMQPTSKALELEPIVGNILDQLTTLRSEHTPFDPAHSSRLYRFSVVDAGLIRLLPPLIRHLNGHAPNVRLEVVPLEIERLESLLESGRLDFAMGSFPSLTKRIRRQLLWSVTYVSAVRRDHPRIYKNPSVQEFSAEKHILVSAAGTGHAHTLAERVIERIVPPENITCRVSTFVAAAIIASTTDAVVTLPASMATSLTGQLGLRLIKAPAKMPRLEVAQYWHERFHRDSGNRWIRQTFSELFGESDRPENEPS